MLKPSKTQTLLGWVTFIVTMFALYMTFIYAPMEKVMGVVQKIFYFHVASAWNAFFAFFIVFVASIAYLLNKNEKWDTIAKVSAEIGVVFTTIVLVTGPIWGHAAWGRWWTWEPRLTTTLILWFIYLAYVLVRASSIEGEKKATMAAVFGIIGFIDVPIVFFAIRWWGSLAHPEVVTGSGGGLDPRMLHALITSVIAFTCIYFYLLTQGILIERTEARVKSIKNQLRERNN